MIYSGDTMYKLHKSKDSNINTLKLYVDPFLERHKTTGKLPYWNGTAVGIDICLNRSHQFNAILDVIQKYTMTM